jgi:hypothetical protein
MSLGQIQEDLHDMAKRPKRLSASIMKKWGILMPNKGRIAESPNARHIKIKEGRKPELTRRFVKNPRRLLEIMSDTK